MPAEIDMSNDRANIAYSGETPWHRLGQKVEIGATVEEWRNASGLTWEANTVPVSLLGEPLPIEGYNAIVRNDTQAVLSIQTGRYVPVQPAEIVDFMARAREEAGLEFEVLMALRGGAVISGLLKVPQADTIKDDKVERYYLVSTSFDGSLPTTARETAIRVVCQNTLNIALRHSTVLVCRRHFGGVDWETAFASLRRAVDEKSAWNTFKDNVERMMSKRLTGREEMDFYRYALDYNDKDTKRRNNKLEHLGELSRTSPGADLDTARGTLWGAFNGVTYFADHEYGRRDDSRLYSAFYGQGALIKDRAYNRAVELLAA